MNTSIYTMTCIQCVCTHTHTAGRWRERFILNKVTAEKNEMAKKLDFIQKFLFFFIKLNKYRKTMT